MPTHNNESIIEEEEEEVIKYWASLVDSWVYETIGMKSNDRSSSTSQLYSK